MYYRICQRGDGRYIIKKGFWPFTKFLHDRMYSYVWDSNWSAKFESFNAAKKQLHKKIREERAAVKSIKRFHENQKVVKCTRVKIK